MQEISAPVWGFNYCEVDPKTQCGCLALTVCPRNREPAYAVRDFLGMPQRIMSPEDLQQHFESGSFPDELSNWAGVRPISVDVLQNAIGSSLRDAIAKITATMPFDAITDRSNVDLDNEEKEKRFRLACHYASHVTLQDLLGKDFGGLTAFCYNYHGEWHPLAHNSSLEQLLHLMCDDIQYLGPLLDTFTHASPTGSEMMTGGSTGPTSVRQFMPLCHVQSAGMLLHLYITCRTTEDTLEDVQRLSVQLVDLLYNELVEKSNVELFDFDEIKKTLFPGHNWYHHFVKNAISSYLVRPKVAVAASFSHEPLPDQYWPYARKLLAMTSMASFKVRSSDFEGLLLGNKMNEREGLMVPGVIYCS